jgi:hypothetical protein
MAVKRRGPAEVDEIRVLSPTAILGYGFPADSLAAGMRRNPHVIAVDAGSTDAGPSYLGIPDSGSGGPAGLDGFARTVTADLRPLLVAAVGAGIPLIVGSAGGAGGNLHVRGVAALVRRIAAQDGLSFRMASIGAEIDRALVAGKLAEGKTAPLGPVPGLTGRDVDQAVRIVAQMGVEPFVAALEQEAQVIIAGRASDPGMFAAAPILAGFDKGLALHMGKILECGAIAADPGSGSDIMMGTLSPAHFVVEPMNPARRCTIQSVAAHSLYEASDPWVLHEPGGIVDLHQVAFAQETDRSVRVSGSTFVPDPVYRVKLEAAELAGYRTICVAGIRDPSVLSHLDEILDDARRRSAEQFSDIDPSGWSLHFHVYGRDGVMGPLEPDLSVGHEAGLLIEVLAPTQDQASSICLFVHAFVLHCGFPGRRSTAGNLAFPFSPQDIPAGPVHRFSIYHLMDVDDPLECFPISLENVGG